MADGSVTIGVILDTAAFSASVSAIQSEIGSLAAGISQSLSNAFSGSTIDASLVTAIQNLSAGISASASDVESAMLALAESSTEAFVSGGWTEAGTQAAYALSDGIYAGGSAAVSAVQSIMSAALASFDGGVWASVGSDMMEGIAAGIYSAGADVVSAICSVARETEDAVKDYYEIRSPSALMRDEVGVMISRGIADGILSGVGYIGGAVEAVGHSTEKMRISDGISGGVITQNIYLRDSDTSPYKTARRIKRESEAIFR